MSFGKSSNNSSQKSQSTSTQQLDPQIKAALLGNYAQAQTLNKPYVPYNGQMVAPLNGQEQDAANGVQGVVNSNLGDTALQQALAMTQAAGTYKPVQVQAATYQPTSATAATTGPAVLASGAQIDPNAVTSVDAPTVGADEINAFLNPYTEDVVNTTNADLQRQNAIDNVTNAGNATKAGAFGGSGSAVLDGLTKDSYVRAMASQDAALQSSGFTTALTAAQAQAAAKLAALQGNQATSLAAGTTNANLGEQTSLTNAGAQNTLAQFLASLQQQTNLANQGATNTGAQFNAGQTQTAQTANQTAGLDAAQLGLNAGAQEGSLSAQQLSEALQRLSALNTTGQQAQATTQAQDTANLNQFQTAQNWPLILQQLLNQSLGLAGDPTLGTSQSTGSGTASGSSFNFGLPTPAPVPS